MCPRHSRKSILQTYLVEGLEIFGKTVIFNVLLNYEGKITIYLLYVLSNRTFCTKKFILSFRIS